MVQGKVVRIFVGVVGCINVLPLVVLPIKMSAGGQCRAQKLTWRGHGDGRQCIH